jgi:hypothetical protein
LLKAPATVTEEPISYGGSTARAQRRADTKTQKAEAAQTTATPKAETTGPKVTEAEAAEETAMLGAPKWKRVTTSGESEPEGTGPQGKGKTPKSSEPDMTQAQQPKVTAPNKSDLDKYRAELNVPERNTVAVGKTDVQGLEGMTFKGASPQVRKDALLPDLDVIAPNRPIQSPGKLPIDRKHAEEGVITEFVDAVSGAGLEPGQVKGTFYVHQSNPKGFCTKCIQGIDKPDIEPGILRQLSERYPNLIIKGSSETIEGVSAAGRHSFTVQNGKYIIEK